MTKLLVAISVVTLAAMLAPQEQTVRTETVHVVSVSRKSEVVEKGIRTDINATADTKTVRYQLSCEEFKSSSGTSASCAQIEAGQNYTAKIWPTAIDFGRPNNVDIFILYSIDSEVEK